MNLSRYFKYLLPVPLVTCVSLSSTGCRSLAVDRAGEGQKDVKQIQGLVEPKIINQTNQRVLAEISALSNIDLDAYNKLNHEIEVTRRGNPALVYSVIISQDKDLMHTASELQLLV